MKGSDVRERFLKYFEGKGHAIVKSSLLVPEEDPSLLFTNAGMNQFKPVFLGSETRSYTRAASSQKCVRAGGKHNDLENVGFTSRHHTFFEMLGNFSFGDYFKEGAIGFAWDLLTRVYKIDASRLVVSVHHTDDEAYTIWRDKMGVPAERIVKLGDKDNFWSMGDTGPCGPCSEIIYDQGPLVGCCKPGCNVECECDRFLEIWNLVFMQYNKNIDGSMVPLPNPSIDTGMGLERMTAILQGVPSNYLTDLFMPLINCTAALAGLMYGSDNEIDTSIRVIADHARACTFLICDGVVPSNEGRGYVLRRILRRASRHGRLLGIEGSFLHRVAMKVIEEFCEVYPELFQRKDFIDKVIAKEEERFLVTLDKGLALLTEAMDALKEGDKIDGETVFKLYDTFGFPVDLTEDIAVRKGIQIDKLGFEAQMSLQREKARLSSSFVDVEAGENLVAGIKPTEFLGYETLEADSVIVALADEEGKVQVDSIPEGFQGMVATSKTPFFAESGGQVGDKGSISGRGFSALVTDTIRIGSVFMHRVSIERGRLEKGDEVRLSVDHARRKSIARHHSATHLLQKAIRDVLGTHVHQSGSYVSEERARFDFTHFSALTKEETIEIEDIVNELVLSDMDICTEIMDKDAAMANGAMALFTEKYSDEVRVVTMGKGVSIELCGGTHCRSTGEIGMVKVVSESSVSAGVRRIEVIAGMASMKYLREADNLIKASCEVLKCPANDLPERISAQLARTKEQENKIRELNLRIATGASAGDEEEFIEGSFKVAIKRLNGEDISQLRDVGDRLKERIKSGVVLLAAPGEEKTTFMIMVTNDLKGKVDAGAIMREVLSKIGGRGGGKAQFAQGGTDAGKLDEAIDAFKEAIRGGKQ